MSNDQHQKFADLLLNSYVTKTPIPPLRDQIEGGMTLDDAYEIQLLQEKAYVAKGDPRRRAQDRPDLAGHAAAARGGSARLRLRHRVDGQPWRPHLRPPRRVHPAQGRAGTGHRAGQGPEGPPRGHPRAGHRGHRGGAYAAIEIIDSRIEDWKISLVDTVSDNASSGGIAYALEPIDVPIPDLDKVECSLRLDGEVVASGVGTDVMGHPIQPMVWLANLLGGERGITLEAGQVVMTGSFTSAFVVEHGHNATADFGELGRSPSPSEFGPTGQRDGPAPSWGCRPVVGSTRSPDQ